MVRVLIFASMIFLVMVISLGAIALPSELTPLPERYAVLHLRDCKVPCWIGIMPSLTRVDEAVSLVRSVFAPPLYTIVDDSSSRPESRELRYNIFLRGEPIFTVGLFRAIDSNGIVLDTVASVGIYFNLYRDAKYRDYSIKEFYNLLGFPTFIYIESVGSSFEADGSLIYRKSGGYLEVNSFDDQMTTQIEVRLVRGLFFYDSKTLDANGAAQRLLKWRGLIPIQEYGKELCSQVAC